MKKARLGQVFLKDANIIGNIIKSVACTSPDFFVEIGCGDGILTQALAAQRSQLQVIEIDVRCIERSQETCRAYPYISWLHQDVRTVDFNQFPSPIAIVANIPYYISAELIQQVVTYRSVLSTITLMVQKEFAQKCVAKPGQSCYTSLSLFTQFYFDVRVLFAVSRQCFSPVPAVDSAMIQLTPKQTLPLPDSVLFEQLIKATFWGKRKKIRTSLTKNPFLHVDPKAYDDPRCLPFLDKRADQLSLAAYVTLTGVLADYCPCDRV